MDIYLFVIMVVLVVAISLVLSKPFMTTESPPKDTTPVGDYESQYQECLRVIKALKDQYEAEAYPEELRIELEEKKRQAAKLLKQFKPDLDQDIS